MLTEENNKDTSASIINFCRICMKMEKKRKTYKKKIDNFLIIHLLNLCEKPAGESFYY